MFFLKLFTTTLIGAGMIVLLMILPKFRDGHKTAYGICVYAIVTYILSVISIWWQ